MKESVSSGQLIAVVIVIGLGMNLLNLPALTVMLGGRDGWLSMLLITAADCVCLFITLLLMDKLRDSPAFAGPTFKVLKVALSALFLLWSGLKAVLALGEIRLFFGKIVFENLDWLVFMILPLLLSAVIGAGSRRGFGRLCQMSLPVVTLAAAIIIFTSFAGDVTLSDVFPTLYDNPGALVSPLKLALWTGNYPVLLCFFRRVDFKKHTKLLAVSAAAAVGAAAVLMTLPLSAVYGSLSHLIDYGSNSSNMTQYVGIYNFGRIDLVIYTVWSVALLLQAGLFQLSAVRSLCALTSREKPRLYSLITAVVLYLAVNILLPTNNHLFSFATGATAWFAVAVQLAAPLIAVLGYFTGRLVSSRGGPIYDEK